MKFLPFGVAACVRLGLAFMLGRARLSFIRSDLRAPAFVALPPIAFLAYPFPFGIGLGASVYRNYYLLIRRLRLRRCRVLLEVLVALRC